MLEWFGSLAQTVIAIGYIGTFFALFVEGLGLPFPGDAVMAFYGFAVAEGRFNLWGVIAISVLGYVCGTSICYVISRKYGPKLLNRFQFLSHGNMMRTTSMIDRFGPLLLIPGRFLPGVRTFSSYAAGMYRMEIRAFLTYTVIGVALWCSAWVMLGFWFGENMKVIMQSVQSWLGYFTLGTITLATIYWLIRKRRRVLR